ncbi:hypothetical protein PUN28_003951 [Cardiocondyla obscurior]|uniref:Uncharacterized protein n=1 Tax=Cardiocondyla obscurior TaxID=286306 RepID=A0AAW2GNA2_9HYME
MVHCKRTLYASPAYSRVFPSIRRRKSIEDETTRVKLVSSPLIFQWKSLRWFLRIVHIKIAKTLDALSREETLEGCAIRAIVFSARQRGRRLRSSCIPISKTMRFYCRGRASEMHTAAFLLRARVHSGTLLKTARETRAPYYRCTRGKNGFKRTRFFNILSALIFDIHIRAYNDSPAYYLNALAIRLFSINLPTCFFFFLFFFFFLLLLVSYQSKLQIIRHSIADSLRIAESKRGITCRNTLFRFHFYAGGLKIRSVKTRSRFYKRSIRSLSMVSITAIDPINFSKYSTMLEISSVNDVHYFATRIRIARINSGNVRLTGLENLKESPCSVFCIICKNSGNLLTNLVFCAF